ncbi:nucleotidyltransferase domain-containing protein [Pseudomonas sp. B6002]|uniref:nucleotidyltransferase domain-containing protein n=1 Tax=Pseudomonas sp. B6002 TaxID=2726978 RepID=UPI0015A402E0|nr:nucleotidyltransferase domain-containing protein [Pseudomonas sp. B6002]NVZ50602.1 nucleotidyltransferase domain-containing protein [Pseudomonas sp. B6002]
MSAMHPAGVDADGFILTVGDGPVQPEFEPLMADVCQSLSQPEVGLHSLYLYGSVARGEASPGVSDLDLTLVLNEPPDAHALELLERIRQTLEQRHPEVIKIDFDIGHRTEVLAPEQNNRWGYWLKHGCRCVWGDDLAPHFELFRPSRDIAQALNGDFQQILAAYRERIDLASDAPERLRLQREASRKLIRSTQTLREHDAPDWPHTLEEHVGGFVQQYPTMRVQVAYFLFEARNPSAERDAFLSRLDTFVAWMVSQQG